VDVGQPAGVDLAFGERVEHEGVVGVGTVGDADGWRHEGILGRKEKREKRKEKGEERKEKGEARRGMPLLTSPFSLLLSLLPS
jgi:hypothetical protein